MTTIATLLSIICLKQDQTDESLTRQNLPGTVRQYEALPARELSGVKK